MAIDTWIRVTLDPAVAKKPDNADHKNSCVGAGSDGGDVTFAYDSAKLTSVSLAKSVMAALTQNLLGRLPL